MELKVIEGTNLTPKRKRSEVYAQAYTRLLERITQGIDVKLNDLSRENLLKLSYVGVMYISSLEIPSDASLKIKQIVFELAEDVKDYLARLTPNELMGIFPVSKEYDGDKWGAKDYFYTMKELHKHGLDKPLGESLDDILWDYENYHLRMFLLRIITSATALYEEQTGVNPNEEFLRACLRSFVRQV